MAFAEPAEFAAFTAALPFPAPDPQGGIASGISFTGPHARDQRHNRHEYPPRRARRVPVLGALRLHGAGAGAEAPRTNAPIHARHAAAATAAVAGEQAQFGLTGHPRPRSPFHGASLADVFQGSSVLA